MPVFYIKDVSIYELFRLLEFNVLLASSDAAYFAALVSFLGDGLFSLGILLLFPELAVFDFILTIV